MAGRIYLLDGDSKLIAMEESLYRDGRILSRAGRSAVHRRDPGVGQPLGFAMGTLPITRRRPHDHDR
jgi:hypothetical protein